MARIVGLSRSRFYALVGKGVFPPPAYLVATRRPYYPQELQQRCLEVRGSGMGFSGTVALFYPARSERRSPARGRPLRSRKSAERPDPVVTAWIERLGQLGLEGLQPAAVRAAAAEAFPDGTEGKDDGAVLSAIYRRLRASRSAG